MNVTQRSDARQIAFAVESARSAGALAEEDVFNGMSVTQANPVCESWADRIVCLTTDQSESVLSFFCTLSSLKMIVTVSLPWR
jgi:hypothetical protein